MPLIDNMNEFSKEYYKIKDVSEMLSIPQSTLRFWEKEFPEINPHRSSTGLRYYTPKDIETIRIVHYLIREKGLKLEAAKEQMRTNKKNVERRLEIITRLEDIRDRLSQLLEALNIRK